VRYEIDELIDGGDCVLLDGRVTTRGRRTGIETTQLVCWVYMVTDGLIVRARAFADRQRALQAAELSE
jgi:ketosteroid isomerase-like protein